VAAKLVGNACIGQSGGPTVVINQSLVGVLLEARKHKEIQTLFGARHGTKGIMKEDFIDLFKTKADWETVAATPAAALGSVRHKPSEDDCAAIFEVFRKRNIRYYFYAGGDDSAKSTHIVAGMARKAGYDLRVVHVPKTIDNNLVGSDHSPGFGSAARFVANAVRGDELDNRSLPGIKVDIIMGRDAGWLTAASMLARTRPGDGPHFIYLPEIPFDMDAFVRDVRVCYQKNKRCLVCVSEGVRDASGTLWAKRIAEESKADVKSDAFGHFQLSGTGALADYLTVRIKAGLADMGSVRVRGDTFGYLQRSFPGFASAVDQKEAREVGRLAVRWACEGKSGSVAIRRAKGKRYKAEFKLIPLKIVAGQNQEVPNKFIAKAGNDIKPSFRDYCLPLVGGLPETETLD
jgi:6-phosphofructokinase 1